MSTFDFSHLKGKVCAITGGAGVIGFSICDALAAAGIKTAIIDINLEAAENMAKILAEKYGTLCNSSSCYWRTEGKSNSTNKCRDTTELK